MKKSVRFRRESSENRLQRSFLVDSGEKALLEHGIRIELRLAGLWFRHGLCRRIRMCGFLLDACMRGGPLGAFLQPLLELVLGDHFSSLLIKLQLGCSFKNS